MTKFLASLIGTMAMVLVPLFVIATVVSADGQETCPQTGGWVKIDSDDLSLYPVDGAIEYCFKAGSDNSQGCIGGLFSSWPQPEGTCALSHWSYRLEEGPPECEEDNCEPTEEPTPSPTELPYTPTPTDVPTDEPQPTPTPTEEGCRGDCVEPTPTPEITPTDAPPVTPELPKTGFTSQYEVMNGEPWIVMVNNDTTVWAAHNQEGWPAGEWWKLWEGIEFEFNDQWYTVTDYMLAEPTDVHLIYSTEPDIILITCRDYDPVTNTWAQRLVIYAEVSQ